MEARQHIVAGISHLDHGQWAEAIVCFDRAIQLREAEPWEHDPHAAWALAAAHLNRGDALRQSGKFRDAIPAYDRAIDAMGHVPHEMDPSCPDRLALAWINRASTRAETLDPDGALDDFTRAANLLDALPDGSSPRRNFLVAMLHGNRARLLLDLRKPVDALNDSRAAVATLRNVPPSHETIAATITALAIHCRALAELLGNPAAPTLEPDWIASATDAAEEALALTARSDDHPSIPDLIRYAARIYRCCQPHFLAEFIHEAFATGKTSAGNIPLVREMIREILLAKIDLEHRVREKSHDTPAVEHELRILSSLQQVERELTGISHRTTPLSRPRIFQSAI